MATHEEMHGSALSAEPSQIMALLKLQNLGFSAQQTPQHAALMQHWQITQACLFIFTDRGCHQILTLMKSCRP